MHEKMFDVAVAFIKPMVASTSVKAISVSMYDDLVRIFNALPKNPVSPENRGSTRLLASAMIHRGQVYRMSLPDMFDDEKPRIVLHPDDIKSLRIELMSTPWGQYRSVESVHQEIADLCEECFATREAREYR
jgi:hypothetical protein